MKHQLMRQVITLEVTFDPHKSILPEAWDWNKLLSDDLEVDEFIDVLKAHPAYVADDDPIAPVL